MKLNSDTISEFISTIIMILMFRGRGAHVAHAASESAPGNVNRQKIEEDIKSKSDEDNNIFQKLLGWLNLNVYCPRYHVITEGEWTSFYTLLQDTVVARRNDKPARLLKPLMRGLWDSLSDEEKSRTRLKFPMFTDEQITRYYLLSPMVNAALKLKAESKDAAINYIRGLFIETVDPAENNSQLAVIPILQAYNFKLEDLENGLKPSLNTITEWTKFCDDLQDIAKDPVQKTLLTRWYYYGLEPEPEQLVRNYVIEFINQVANSTKRESNNDVSKISWEFGAVQTMVNFFSQPTVGDKIKATASVMWQPADFDQTILGYLSKAKAWWDKRVKTASDDLGGSKTRAKSFRERGQNYLKNS